MPLNPSRKKPEKEKKMLPTTARTAALVSHGELSLPLNSNTTSGPAPSFSASSCSSDSGSETGWADVNPSDDAAEKLKIVSLVDEEEFDDPLAMLEHCQKKAGFDFLEVKQRLGLGFEGAVRLVNFGEFYSCSSVSVVDLWIFAILFQIFFFFFFFLERPETEGDCQKPGSG